MNKRNLQRFRRQLNDQLEELLHQVGGTMKDLQRVDMPGADPLDNASEESSRSLFIRIRNRENRLIRKILQSLRDIDEGTYGYCEGCGESIGIKRLEARPVAQYCIQCKTKMEKIERLIEH